MRHRYGGHADEDCAFVVRRLFPGEQATPATSCTSLAKRAGLSEYQTRAKAHVLRRPEVSRSYRWMADMSDKRSGGDTIGLLGQTDLFKDLTAGELTACAAKFREQRLSKGQILFARGD